MIKRTHNSQSPPPEVVADVCEYYYRNANGDMIRIDGLSISPMRSPESLRNSMAAKDRRDADVLIKAIVDEIINKTEVMPAHIHQHRIGNDKVMSMVTEYFNTTPYAITKSLVLQEWKWFVDFRTESLTKSLKPDVKSDDYFPKTHQDLAFALCCATLIVMSIIFGVSWLMEHGWKL